MIKDNIILFPFRSKDSYDPIQSALQKSYTKKQSLYLATLLHAVPDDMGWLRLTQKEVQRITHLRPETQKKYRILFCQSGILESKRVANCQGRVYLRFNPNFFKGMQMKINRGALC